MMEPIFSPALLAILPDASKAKALRWDDEAQAAFWAIGPARDREDAARTILARRRNEKLNLVASIEANNRKYPGDSERIAELQVIEDAAQSEVDRLGEASRQVVARWEELVAPAKFARDWLGERRLADPQPGRTKLRHAPLPKIGKVEFVSEVAETRLKIAAKADEIERTHHAPLPVADQLSRVMADIERRAERGAPDYDARRREKPAIDLERSFNHPSATADFIVWLHRDAIAERLKALVGSKDQPGALSDIDREKRLAQLAAEKLEWERREEAMICAAEAIGQRIARRPDADPRSILEIE